MPHTSSRRGRARRPIMFNIMALAATLAIVGCFDSKSWAAVFVQPTEIAVNQSLTVGGGRLVGLPISLEQGEAVRVTIQVSGGLNNAVQVWLVDLPNFQLLQSGQRFTYWTNASSKIVGAAEMSFVAPTTNVYYVALDNRANLFARNLSIQADRDVPQATRQSTALSSMYLARYNGLRKIFVFREFNIYVRNCGQANAFSSGFDGDITMCSEFLREVARERVPQAEEFVFYHEAAHSLLNLWGYPEWDNEDTADELATVMLMFLNRDRTALLAAQFYASLDSRAELTEKLVAFDRHSLSVQRARNVLNWLGRKQELESRWLHVMIPNMQTAFLSEVVARSRGQSLSATEPPVILAIRNELQVRQARTAK